MSWHDIGGATLSKQTLRAIKQRKGFYRNSYRRAVVMLIFSLLINIGLIGGIYYKLITIPERDYYATSGIKPPIKLTAMATPNYSSKYLLAPDPVNSEESKPLPEGN